MNETLPDSIILQTPRMVLRKFRFEDERLLFELDNDPEVMRFISKGRPTPLEEIQTRILPRFLKYYNEFPPRGFWAAESQDFGTFLGWFHLRPDKFSPQDMELGYRLKREAWGKGLATEGAAALVAKGFHEWNYSSISARTLLINIASRRVMEKVGMRFECEFLWPAEMLPEWTEEERRGVKYIASRPD
jgi:RimJ/RimL family protein N-acetyltransferase